MSISPITLNPAALAPLGQTAAANSAAPAANGLNSVGATFQQALDGLNTSQSNSDALIRQLSAGENVDLHQVMISTEEADISMRVALAMRDKLVDAYHEIMRMSV